MNRRRVPTALAARSACIGLEIEDSLCELLRAKTDECVSGCARIRPLGETLLVRSLTATLRILAKRWLALRDEIKILDPELEQLTNDHAPRLRQEFGVGAQTAAVSDYVAGDNPDRLKNELPWPPCVASAPCRLHQEKRIAIV
jgi:transposase